MKKFIVTTMMIAASMSTFAKSKQDDVDHKNICMIRVDDEGTVRFINAFYIRSVEIVLKDTVNSWSGEANPNMIQIKMASNYANKNVYKIAYNSNAQAEKAALNLVEKIENCKQ